MKYELSITPGYCSGWTVVQAVRELLQNAIDSNAPFEVEFNGNSISIISRGVTLPVNTLLLGSTDKFNDTSKIGNFGEGYKIALLILTRKNKKPIVYNGKRTWTTRFTYSKAFQADVLTIDEEHDSKGGNYQIGNEIGEWVARFLAAFGNTAPKTLGSASRPKASMMSGGTRLITDPPWSPKQTANTYK